MRYVLALVLAGITGVTADPFGFAQGAPSALEGQQQRFDIVIKGGLVYDGTGGAPVRADVGITGDQIAAISPALPTAGVGTVIDASGLAVAPGFINMLSWATESL